MKFRVDFQRQVFEVDGPMWLIKFIYKRLTIVGSNGKIVYPAKLTIEIPVRPNE